MQLNLPKGYLSYSQMRSWLYDKEGYRDSYYRGLKSEGSKWLKFGAWFSDKLENDREWVMQNVPNLPLLEVAEFNADFQVDEVPFVAWVDQYDPAGHRFREIKTGVRKFDGSARWTQAAVEDHLQLDVYSLLIWLKTGKVEDECWLDWVVTRPKKKTISCMGRELIVEDPSEMELSGEVISFPRKVTQADRDRVRALIRSVAHEISADYSAWLSANLALRPATSPALSMSVSSVLSGT